MQWWLESGEIYRNVLVRILYMKFYENPFCGSPLRVRTDKTLLKTSLKAVHLAWASIRLLGLCNGGCQEVNQLVSLCISCCEPKQADWQLIRQLAKLDIEDPRCGIRSQMGMFYSITNHTHTQATCERFPGD